MTTTLEEKTHSVTAAAPTYRGLALPQAYFLTSGRGDATKPLVAFDRALIDAGIADVNLLKLSSIVGPRCRRIRPVRIEPGAFVGVAYGSTTAAGLGTRIASAVAIAHPDDRTRASVVMEHSLVGSKKDCERIVREMAVEAMGSRGLGIRAIESVAIEHNVSAVGSTFAAVVEV